MNVAILFSRVKVAGRIATIPHSVQFAAGLVLTVVAGFVDAVCYVELGGFFASFISGASISLGVSASGQQWTAAYHAAFLILVFRDCGNNFDCHFRNLATRRENDSYLTRGGVAFRRNFDDITAAHLLLTPSRPWWLPWGSRIRRFGLSTGYVSV